MDIHLAINLFQLAVRSELTLTDRPFMQANLPLGCGYYMQILAGPMTGSVPSNVVLWDVEFTKLPVRLCTRLGLDLLPSAHPVLAGSGRFRQIRADCWQGLAISGRFWPVFVPFCDISKQVSPPLVAPGVKMT